MTKNIDQVIILGAGASKSEGIPVQKELIKKYLNSRRQAIRLKPSESAAINCLEKFWGLPLRGSRKTDVPTFEECMGILELAEIRGETYRDFDSKKIIDGKRSLICAIAQILEEKSKVSPDNHNALLKRLINKDSLKRTAFISLNYELMIDRAITSLWPDYQLDYGIGLVNFDRSNDWERPDPNKRVLLLKIHGSFNWRYCPTCNCVELILLGDPNNKILSVFEGKHRCPTCKSPFEPILIPPTFYKDMTNPFLRQIYLQIDEVLRKCDKIFFCGYSFPDADMHFKYLLKRAEMFRVRPQRIFVVNEYPGKNKYEREQEKDRFKRFYKESRYVEYTKKSFEKFCQNGHRRIV